MKKIFIACLCLCTAFMAVSCDKEDNVAKKYQVKVSVSADGAQLSELKDFKVEIATTSGEKINLEADKANTTYTASVVAGTYTVNASASNELFNFAASQSVTVVDQDVEAKVVLKSSPKQPSGIIFKEVYFCGVADFYFADAFYELVNNSDEVKYLDGIIFAQVERGYGDDMSSWADSTGAIPTDFYPLTGYIMQFPGKGKDYPVQPGQSVVIANQAMDHTKRELTDADVASPSKLDDADWELHIPTSKKSIDNPDVPNMELIYGSGGFYFMPAVAGAPLALIQLPEGVSGEAFVNDSTMYHAAPGKSSLSLCVPCNYILDAIDIQRHGETQIVKVFHPAQDAGYTWISGGDETAPDYECTFESWTSPYYCGKGLRRKCTMVTNEGRAYFKDTNNSSEDFILGGQKPVIRRQFKTAD